MNRLIIIFMFLSTFSFAQNESDSVNQITDAKKKIEMIRMEILSGKISFTEAAKKYSQDPGSASNGGTYLKVQKGNFVPEFESVAYSVKENTVSEIFKTQYGYHILMVLERRADQIDVRHILITP